MKLHYWRSPGGNFGDDLNAFLWDRYLPGFFDEDPSAVFIGVGTLLADDAPQADRVVVFGSGAGYRLLPRPDQRWDFRAVRGPLTARALNLPPEAAVTDPACLLGDWSELYGKSTGDTIFVPHWENAGDKLWKAACAKAGIAFVSPTGSAAEVIRVIGSAKLVITESMHGAILADAFRVPFVPVIGTHSAPFKWHDWAASLGMEYVPVWLPRRRGLDALAGRPVGQKQLNKEVDFREFVGRTSVHKRSVEPRPSIPGRVINRALFAASVDAEARALEHAAHSRTFLSVGGILAEKKQTLCQRLDSLASSGV